MTTKKIGLPMWKTGDNSFGSTLSYIMYLQKFGEVIPLMPKHTLRTDLDLLVLPGGVDINPLTYGELPDFFTQKPDLHKEHFDKVYLPQYIAAGIPVLGICRGNQSIAVHFGGKLIQDMSHETNKPDDPYSPVHQMIIPDNVNLKIEIPQHRMIAVNSRHHQVVARRNFPDCLTIIGQHQRDKTIEMIAHKTLPIVGIQSHVEDTFDTDSAKFFASIVKFLITEKVSIL